MTDTDSEECDWPSHAGYEYCVHRPPETTTGDDFDFDVTLREIRSGEPVDYYDYLEVLKILTKGLRKKTVRVVDFDEWREPPGYPGYQMHSLTRALWSQARTVTTKNDKTRHYAAKLITPANGRVSLSVDGAKSTRSVTALYLATFPEAK